MSEKKPRDERLEKLLATARRILHDAFTKNLHLKILSLVLAFIAWPILLLNIDSVVRTRPMNDVLVRFDGEDYFNQNLEYAIVENLSDLVRTVDVDVRISQHDSAYLDYTRVSASIDLSRITHTGVQELAIIPRTDYGTIADWSPRSITVTVEKRKSKNIPVKIQGVSELPAGYHIIETPTARPGLITISGAESVVDSIQSALVPLDYASLVQGANDFDLPFDVIFADANGEDVAPQNLETPDGRNVIVSGRMLPTALKPIVFDENNFYGSPSDGYELQFTPTNYNNGVYTELSEDQRYLEIAAPQEVLDSIDSLTFEPINIENDRENSRKPVVMRWPSGVEWMEPKDIDITVGISEIVEERAYNNIPLEIRGVRPDTKAEIDEDTKVRVAIEAVRSALNRMSAYNIVAYVDLSEFTEGVLSAKVEVEFVEIEDFTKKCTTTPDYVTIELVKEGS